MKTIASVWFDRHEGQSTYAQYSKVWNVTARRVFGGSDNEIICKAADPPDFTSECPTFHRGNKKIGPSKTFSWLKKIEVWNDIVQNANGPVLMSDIDVAFFGDPFDELDKLKYDVAYVPPNTGLVYFSGSKRSKKFMRLWYLVTQSLVMLPDLYREYDKKYKGLDQASMGFIMEHYEKKKPRNMKIINLNPRFHCVWKNLNKVDEPYVVHYHSLLRSSILRGVDVPDYVRPWLDAWKEALDDNG